MPNLHEKMLILNRLKKERASFWILSASKNSVQFQVFLRVKFIAYINIYSNTIKCARFNIMLLSDFMVRIKDRFERRRNNGQHQT